MAHANTNAQLPFHTPSTAQQLLRDGPKCHDTEAGLVPETNSVK